MSVHPSRQAYVEEEQQEVSIHIWQTLPYEQAIFTKHARATAVHDARLDTVD